MKLADYLEAMGIVVVAMACAVVSHVFSIPSLDSWSTMIFGAALGYLAKQMGVQLPPSSH